MRIVFGTEHRENCLISAGLLKCSWDGKVIPGCCGWLQIMLFPPDFILDISRYRIGWCRGIHYKWQKAPPKAKVIWFSACTDGCWLTWEWSDGTGRSMGTLSIKKHWFTKWITFWRSVSYGVVISNAWAQRWGFPAGGLLGIASLWLPAWCKDVVCYGYLGVTAENNTGCFTENSNVLFIWHMVPRPSEAQGHIHAAMLQTDTSRFLPNTSAFGRAGSVIAMWAH